VKTIHMAALISPDGKVAALCAGTIAPRPINLRKASWTNREQAVTCPGCKAALTLKRKAGA
jgi:hypothetical protein